MKRSPLTLKIFALIVSTDILDSLAQLFMKKGLVVTGIDIVTFSNLFDFISRNTSSPLVWVGLFFYAVSFFAWIVVLTQVDLSIALPLGSTSYILIPSMAMFFLHETISPIRWLGIFLIIGGIHFVSKSKQQTAPATP